MHSYFYGERLDTPPGMPPLSTGSSYLIGGEQNTDLALFPSSSVISFSDLSIWRIGEGECC